MEVLLFCALANGTSSLLMPLVGGDSSEAAPDDYGGVGMTGGSFSDLLVTQADSPSLAVLPSANARNVSGVSGESIGAHGTVRQSLSSTVSFLSRST